MEELMDPKDKPPVPVALTAETPDPDDLPPPSMEMAPESLSDINLDDVEPVEIKAFA